jgi:hypothetical protein
MVERELLFVILFKVAVMQAMRLRGTMSLGSKSNRLLVMLRKTELLYPYAVRQLEGPDRHWMQVN